MSSEVTTRLLEAYVEDSPRSSFLSSLFRSPEQNFHSSEEVEIDVVRSDEDVAVVITDLSQSARSNSADLYTNKKFVPPIYSEEFAINAYDLIKRIPGQNPFQDPQFQLTASNRFMDNMRKVQAKIARAIELQASQVLTTGQLDLQDSAGNSLYTVDFSPKGAHFPTAGTAWNAGADIQADLLSLCNVIRNNGKVLPDQVIMGETSYQEFINDSTIGALFDNRRINVGDILGPGQTELLASGGEFRGTLKLGNFTLQIWTYGGRYKNPNGGAITNYVPNDKVIVRAAEGRLDASFGAIPQIVSPEARVLPFLPENIQMTGQAMSLSTFAWVTPNGRQLMGEAGARPLMIPTAIDTFGCITTGV